MGERVLAFWDCVIPENKNTARYQRAKLLTSEYDVEFVLLHGDENEGAPDELEERALNVEVRSSTGIVTGLSFIISQFYQKLIKDRDKYSFIHTSYHPISITIGFLFKIMGVTWVYDMWDDPNIRFVLGHDSKLLTFFHLILLRSYVTMIERSDVLVLALNSDILDFLHINHDNVVHITNGTSEETYRDIYSFENPSKYGLDTEKFNIVFIGDMAFRRGTDILFKAIPYLDDKIENGEIFLVGYHTPSVRRYVEHMDTDIDINLVGEVSHEEALGFTRDSDVCTCIFGDFRETRYIYPIKLFEYMALGKVSVASSLPGIKEIIEHKENGLLVEPGNRQEIADKIEFVYENQDNLDSMEKNAQESVKKFYWRNINSELKEELNSKI